MIFQSAVWKSLEIDDDRIQVYSKRFKTEPLITKLLLDRGMESEEAVEAFLHPTLDEMHDPFLFEGMEIAVKRIQRAVSSGEQIWIYGDYDVDGITSITVMCKYFRHIGIHVNYYIPDRHDEGYGISRVGIDHIKKSGGTLIVTVDSGITAVDEVAYANEQGIDIIVTDHHECQETLPSAVAVINPKLEGYPFKMLCGCGVALKLIQALMNAEFEDFVSEVIDIAALGTIADIVPLTDENRIITKIGLAQMQKSTTPGIRALIKEANLEGKEINAGHIGFVIAPRINASGRIGDPKVAVEMLLTEDAGRAEEIAASLSALNSERQAQERVILEEAVAYIEANIDLEREKVMLVCGRDWHTGIIGIVASKLCDRYARPVVILNVEGDEAKGSARSVEGVNIFEILNAFKHFYLKFGGHEQAAGLTLKSENVEKLKMALLEYSEAHLSFKDLIHKRRVDGVLKPQLVNHKLIDEIDALKPFGLANPKPQFVFENLILEDFKCIGKDQNHLKMIVNDSTRVYDALAFNQAELSRYLRRSDTVHLLLNLEINHFMGVETIQFLIKDVVKAHMPLSDLIELKMAKAMTAILESDFKELNICKFTTESDFDIIFSVPQNKRIFIFSIEGMIRLKDYVFGRNWFDYTLHFNKIDEKECREGHVDIIFMPFKEVMQRAEGAVIFEENWNNAVHVPNRSDLMHFYKNIGNLSTFDIRKLSGKLNLSLVKCFLCLDLLTDMKLIEYSEKSGRVCLKALPKPKERINLEELVLYKKIHEPQTVVRS